ALRPWLDTLVVVGGWAHRLHFEHQLAGTPGFQPVRTRDADVAFATNARLGGNIAQALSDAGFAEDLSSEETPPIAQYVLGGMVHPWTFTLGGANATLPEPVELRVANPAAFIAQKLLIHGTRKANKQAQDILYIHDTLQLFGAQWTLIAELWREH